MIIKGIFRLILLLYSSPLPQYSADHTPSSPSIPYHIYSSYHKPHTSHPHEPPSSPYLLKAPASKTPLIIPLRLVRPPYRAVTAGTAIEHPHRAEPWMPSSCHRVPGTGNTLSYPRAGPFMNPA